MDVIVAEIGATRRLKLTLERGTYDGSEVLSAVVWPGDDRAVLFTPSVAWLDPATRTISLEWAASDTASLSPGRYQLGLRIASGGDLVKLTVGVIDLRPTAGTATARPTYCSYDDMRRHAGTWLDALSASATYQTGAAEERADAREALDAAIMGRWSGSGVWLREQLDADRLILSEPVRRWNVLWSLHLVCRRQITAKDGKDNPYWPLADWYRAEAESLLPTLLVELDLDGDGEADLSVPMGLLRIYRG